MRALLLLLCVGLLTACASRSSVVYPLPGNGLCELHHVPMERKIVQVTYGYPAYNEA